MKVEVGESIVYSWLRHIKRCEVVQLNWKTSPKWDARHDVGFLQRAMDKANEEFNGLFKKTKTVEQLLKQAEIDAMGVNIREHEIHAVDVAFHENGLDLIIKGVRGQNGAASGPFRRRKKGFIPFNTRSLFKVP